MILDDATVALDCGQCCMFIVVNYQQEHNWLNCRGSSVLSCTPAGYTGEMGDKDDANKKVTAHDCCCLDRVLYAYCSELWQEHLTHS